MTFNPYQSPSDTTREDREDVALAALPLTDDDDPIALRINVPAFGLSAIAWMRLVFEGPLLVYASVLLIYNIGFFSGNVVWASVLFALAAGAVWIDLLILRGATAMLSKRHIERARVAAYLALLPTSPLFILNVPFGIWVLRVLNDREVAGRFPD